MSGLPRGWAQTTLGDIAKLRGEKTTPASVPDAPFIGLEDIESNTSRILNVGKGSDVKSAVAMFSAGDVLYSRLRPYLNKVAVAEFDGVASAEILVMQPTEATTAEFVRRRIMTPEFLDFAALLDKGDRPRVNYSEISRFPIALPPLPEQQRIVAKVDGLTARTARARADLARIPTLIARYKQRLLALAFSGELTAGWRTSHPQPLGRQRAISGIDGRNGSLAEIPNNWKWTSFGQVADVTGGLTKNQARGNLIERAPYLRVANVYANELRLDDLAEIGCTAAELAKTRLVSGDLLIVEGNGSIEQVGRVALWRDEIEGCSHQNHIIRARPHPDLLPSYGLFWLLSPGGRAAIESVASSSSGLHTLSITKVKGFPIPYCEPEEQTEITRRIESAFNWLDRMAADHAAAAKLLPKLDAAILAKAFKGELVPQDPTDEPATALLARIKMQQLDTPKKGRGRNSGFRLGGDNVVHTPLTIPRPAKESAMTKSRQDDDVMGKPYLAALIKAGHDTTAQGLFKAADLPVADFYKQLAWEIAHKHIRDDDEKLEAL